jgi:hypothetical protein
LHFGQRGRLELAGVGEPSDVYVLPDGRLEGGPVQRLDVGDSAGIDFFGTKFRSRRKKSKLPTVKKSTLSNPA